MCDSSPLFCWARSCDVLAAVTFSTFARWRRVRKSEKIRFVFLFNFISHFNMKDRETDSFLFWCPQKTKFWPVFHFARLNWITEWMNDTRTWHQQVGIEMLVSKTKTNLNPVQASLVESKTKKASPKHVSKLVNGCCHSHTSSLSPSVVSPPHTLLPSGLEGDGGGDTCTSNLSVSYLLMTPTDYQSLHLTGKCRHAPRLIQRRLRKHSCPIAQEMCLSLSSLKSTWQHQASGRESVLSTVCQHAHIWRECINVFEVNLQ